MKSKVLVIIPAYNEEAAIEKTCKKVLKEKVDCIVINDCSSDDTERKAFQVTSNVISLSNNLGIGGAVQTGYIYAYKNHYDIAIQLDGDGQHNPKYIPELVKKIEEGYDMVIGSRFISDTAYDQTFFRMLGIKIIRNIIKLFSGKTIMDPTSGFRAVNKDIIKQFAIDYPYDYPEPITNLQILKNKRYKVLEISTKMNQRETGTSSITAFKSIYYMVKVTLALFIELLRGDK